MLRGFERFFHAKKFKTFRVINKITEVLGVDSSHVISAEVESNFSRISEKHLRDKGSFCYNNKNKAHARRVRLLLPTSL